METRRLQAFIQIVDSGSMTRAANLLGVAQPALSQQVVDLEHQFGVKLLNRSNLGVTPTPAGLRLYRHAQLILRQLEVATRDVAQGIDGAVRIGIVSTYSSMILPAFLTRAQAAFPSISVSIWEGLTSQIIEKTANRSLEIGVVIGKPSLPGIDSRQLISETLYLASSARQPAPVSGETVLVSALAGVPLVVPNEGSAQRKLIDYAFTMHGLRPRIAAEVDSLGGSLSAIKAGIGAAILTETAAANDPGDLRLQRIEDIMRTVSIISAAETGPSPSSAEIIRDLLISVMRDLVGRGAWPSAVLLGGVDQLHSATAEGKNRQVKAVR